MDAAKKVDDLRRSMTNALFDNGASINKQSVNAACIIAVEEILSALKTAEPDWQNTTYWHPIDFYSQVLEILKSK